MLKVSPFLLTDSYKLGHIWMYPEGTQTVYSNFTPRSNKYAPKGCDKVVSFGQQMTMKYIHDIFYENFFGGEMRYLIEEEMKRNPDYQIIGKELLSRMRDAIIEDIKTEYELFLGTEYDMSHIEALWDLGYLPVKVKALPEGTTVPMGVPVLTIYNTKGEFYWLTNFLETIISTLLWKPMTSATIANNFYKNIVKKYADLSDKDNPALRFLGHDFSMRGLDSEYAAMSSGLGHALSFHGSDSLPVIPAARYYYNAVGGIIHSVNATEHSVMCAGTKDDEIGTFRYLMKQFPKGILSIVSDTWDLWKVVGPGGYLSQLKEEILARDGRIVIRPDSGDPVDIICGTNPKVSSEYKGRRKEDSTPAEKGVVELLWDIFGGTINEQGYKVLDPHIGAIYGDSINDERAIQISERLMAKGFASTNVVLGIGSFTYQFNTRDTFGFAMKATYVEITCNDKERAAYGLTKGREIFKDPITDDGTKKSARGLLQVINNRPDTNGGDLLFDGKDELVLNDQVTWDQENGGLLTMIYDDGEFLNQVNLETIRERLNAA